MGIYRPGQAIQRVTSNAGNRRFIKGGLYNKSVLLVEVPVFIGPDIAQQSAVAGVPFTFDAGARFDYPAGSEFSWIGPTGGWLLIDPATGVLSGANPIAGTLTGVVQCVHNALVAQSNQFQIVVTP